MPMGQPSGGGGPATAISPPTLTKTPVSSWSAIRAADRSATSAFADDPRSRRTPLGIRTVRDRASMWICPYPTTGPRTLEGSEGRSSTSIEITVVAEGRHGIADRWINGTICLFGDGDGDLESLEEKWRDGDRCTRTRMKVGEFRVRTKAAARQIDRFDLVRARAIPQIRPGRERAQRPWPSFRCPERTSEPTEPPTKSWLQSMRCSS